MIDKEKLIKDIRAYADLKCANGEIEIANGILKTLSIIEAQPNVDNWIPVSERLPESEDDSVLAQFNNGSIETVHIQDYFNDITAGLDENGNQLYTKWYISQGVIAWQPLPEPWKE